MNILCITSSYPRHDGDIAGLFVHELSSILAEAGHRVRLFCWSDTAPETFHPDGYEVVRVRYAPRPLQTLFFGAGAPENLDANRARLALAAPALAAMAATIAAQARHADLVIGHWLVPGGLLARMVGRLVGKPSLVVGHSGGVHLLGRLPEPIGALMRRLILSGPTTVPTRALAARLGHGVQVLSMGYHPTGAEPGGRDWLCMGRLVPIKGFDLALRAFASAGVEATLHVAGDGPERARLERLAHERKVRVRFHGFVQGEAKRAVLARCGHLLLPSRILEGRHEGLPVTLLEASDAGLLPLVSDFPGVHDFVASPRLQVLAPDDEHLWVRRIRELDAMADTKKADLVAQTRQLARQFCWPVLGDRWVQVVEQAAGAHF